MQIQMPVIFDANSFRLFQKLNLHDTLLPLYLQLRLALHIEEIDWKIVYSNLLIICSTIDLYIYIDMFLILPINRVDHFSDLGVGNSVPILRP